MSENTEVIDTSQEPDEPIEQSAGEAPNPSTEHEAGQDTAGQPSEQPKPNGAERRIGQMRARLSRAEEQRDYWRDQAMRAQQEQRPQQQQPQPQTEDPPKRPRREDFDGDVERYADAVAQYTDDVRQYDRRQAQLEREREQRAAEESRRKAALSEREREQYAMIEKGRAAREDFDEVISGEWLCSAEMLDVMTDLPNGEDVMYTLASKPAEAARFNQMSGRPLALAMAQFAATLSAPSAPAKRESGAPPPPTPPKGSGDNADNLADPGKAKDMGEYMRRFNAQERKRRRG